MNYVQLSDAQRREMLDTIGVQTVDELFHNVPSQFKLDRALDLPKGMSELELQRALAKAGGANTTIDDLTCFMGCGAYDHFIPSLVNDLVHRGDFFTAYTPYQAEASQGSLQAFFEFQTQVSRLAGLDISNASLYEGATSLGEAVFLALNHSGKRRVVVSQGVHPHYIETLRTSCNDLPIDLIEVPVGADGQTAVESIKEQVTDDTACVVVQSPNVYGVIEDWDSHFETAHAEKKTLGIAVFNPIAAALLKTPGACGADIAVGDGQPLGIPLQFGGPWLGLFAAKQNLLRKMPGRLIGQTEDAEGRRAFCLTLQTREQHIRGAKATSNVCTNQGLLALRATVFMSAMGPEGLHGMAEQSWHKAHYAAEQIAGLPGYELTYPEANFFHEFVVTCPRSASDTLAALKTKGYLGGVNLSKLGIGEDNQILVTVTEKRTRDEIDSFVAALKEVAG